MRSRVAVIGQPGAWSTERLAAALRAEGAEACVVDLAACALSLPEGAVRVRGERFPDVDAIVVKKIGDTAAGWAVRERLTILRELESSGIPVLSAPDRLEIAVNRYRMTVELARAGVPIPETVITEDVDAAAAAVARFGAAVLKPLFTSKGRGMQRLVPGPALTPALEGHRRSHGGPFYLQRFVTHPGRDLGVAVLEGRPLGAYWRVARAGEWMTTILSGGRYERADPPAAAIEIALKAARHFGLVFTGVDLMETPEGELSVLEVSAFGGFRGLLAGCGVDAAPLLARTVLARARGAAAA